MSYKLYYFPLRARAEIARLLFAQAGVAYEDIRVTGDSWAALKSSGKAPFGQLPLLEDDGRVLAQSGAIMRHLARKLGLDGQTEWERALADQAACGIEELREALSAVSFERDEAKREAARQVLVEKKLPHLLAVFEKLLGGGEYLAGAHLTYADLLFFDTAQALLAVLPTALDGHPGLKALYTRVGALPKIAAWVESRPHSAL